jgi:hypothetical protein
MGLPAPDAVALLELAASSVLLNSGDSSPAVALSTSEIVLAVLKYLSAAVAAASGLWALTHKLSFDDEHNVRHLTPAGKAALAFGVGSFLVASAAAGVELLLANIKKQNQLLSEAASKAASADKERRAAEEAARVRDLLLKNLATAALSETKRRADSTAQRLLSLETAAREERRDNRLALRVGGVAVAEQQNTGRVLKSLWEEAHRIEGTRIEVLAEHNCTSKTIGKRLSIIGQPSQVSMILFGEEGEDLRPPVIHFAQLASVKAMLFSLKQEELDLALEGEADSPIMHFHTFYAFAPDAIASPEDWRKGYVKLVIQGLAARDLPADLEGPGNSEAMSRVPKSWASDNNVTRLLPCSITTTLLINGRTLATGTGPIGLTGDGQKPATFVAEIPTMPVDNAQLPRYSR